jgi:hypothetical protein
MKLQFVALIALIGILFLSSHQATLAQQQQNNRCDPTLLPTAPTVKATAGDKEVKLCWNPTNDACVSQFRIAVLPLIVQATPNSPVPQWMTLPPIEDIKTRCFTVKNLNNMQHYRFAVQAYSNAAKGGSAATVDAAPQIAWRCLPVRGYYPLCDAVYQGDCNPVTCKEQKEKGQCNAPFMRQVNEASRLIVQHCATECGCSADPTLGGVKKADGPQDGGGVPFSAGVSSSSSSATSSDGTKAVPLEGLNGYDAISGCCSTVRPIYVGY